MAFCFTVLVINLMSRQLKNRFQRISGSGAKSSLKELYQDNSFLLNHLRGENYLIFEPETFNKNSRISIKSRSQSHGQLYLKSRTNILNSSKQKKYFNLRSEGVRSPQKQPIPRQQSEAEIVNHAFNNILTKACLMRNQKKKTKFMACRNPKIVVINGEKEKQGLKAYPKLIVPREVAYEHLTQLKDKQSVMHEKIKFKIKKKKRHQFNRSLTVNPGHSEEIQLNLDAWDHGQELDFHQF